MLTEKQTRQYNEQGFVVAPGVVSESLLAGMIAQLDEWIEESRAHEQNFGPMMDGKMRFDLQDGHCREKPGLRRVANPVDLSQAYRDVLFEGAVVEAVACVVGPNVKFHHCKLNTKLPGMETRVDYHQDHAFDPHTNDDHVTALVLLDDMSEENGCLRVVPGSHKGPRHTHYVGDDFVGKVDDTVQAVCEERAVPILGKAGDLCLMSTWALHGGGANRTTRPRRMLICDYTAADAFPLGPPMVPSPHSGKIVKGSATRMARFRSGVVELPKRYEADSFFGAQGQKTAGGMA